MGFGNQLRTLVLLASLTGILLWIGSFWGSDGLTFAIIFAVIMNFGSYWFSDKIVLAMYRAREVTEAENPRLYKLVKEVSHLANLPKPKVYIVNSANPNAFATGRDYNHAAVAATTGILELLNDEELKGVIAHEVSHIRNRDTLIQATAATIAGVISYVAMMARWAAMFGGFGGRDRDRNGSGIELIVLAIITPIIATLIQLAISRNREYQADESAAKLLHNGFGLANALEKLEGGIKRHPLKINGPAEATAHLFIASPFRAGGIVQLFSTHPPIAMRVKKLKDMSV